MPVIRRALRTPTPDLKPQGQDCYKRAYNVREAAQYLSVSVWQVREWVKEGLLKSAPISKAENAKQLFDKRELDRFLDELFGRTA